MEIKHGLSRRHFMKLSSALGVTVALAACAPPQAGAPAQQQASGSSQQAAAPAAEVTKLQYQSREPEIPAGLQKLWDEWLPKFKEAHPNLDVDFLPDPGGNEKDVALASMVAGTAADIMEFCCENSTFFIQQDQSTDLQPLIDRDAAEVKIDDYYAHQFDPWKRDGNIHMMPRFTGSMLIYYNVDWFQKAGIEAPPSEWGKWDWLSVTS